MKAIRNISGQTLGLIVNGETVIIHPREELIVKEYTAQMDNMASARKRMLKKIIVSN